MRRKKKVIDGTEAGDGKGRGSEMKGAESGVRKSKTRCGRSCF